MQKQAKRFTQITQKWSHVTHSCNVRSKLTNCLTRFDGDCRQRFVITFSIAGQFSVQTLFVDRFLRDGPLAHA
jgi:hypothetical protein